MSNPKFKTRHTVKTAPIILGHVFGLLYKNTPYTIPVKNAVNVKPGKNAPEGNNATPKRSPIVYAIPALNGPYIIAIIAIGKKPNPILTIGV